MILTGAEIERQVGKGDIEINPFDPKQLNPNSYNLRLMDRLVLYDCEVLDLKKDNKTLSRFIPPDGYLLRPGRLYLGSTIESTHTDKFVPMIEGRSSIARLGVNVHISAGFGDLGFNGRWTLEITVVQPVRIYAGIEICQIYYHKCIGERQLYRGKYNGQTEPVPSRLYREFEGVH